MRSFFLFFSRRKSVEVFQLKIFFRGFDMKQIFLSILKLAALIIMSYIHLL